NLMAMETSLMFISPLTLLPGSRQCFLFFVTKSQNLVMNQKIFLQPIKLFKKQTDIKSERGIAKKGGRLSSYPRISIPQGRGTKKFQGGNEYEN
ncbi:hypothetical protein, partial [Geobacillus stearothermophilus]|uniref:hypothetical protein n=1 Tax=Geobacillus stearothermophilus TaxID=1422 RepID=UPI003D193AE0